MEAQNKFFMVYNPQAKDFKKVYFQESPRNKTSPVLNQQPTRPKEMDLGCMEFEPIELFPMK